MIEFFWIVGVLALIAGVFGGVVWLAERKVEAELKEEQQHESLRRLREAIEADARGRERLARGELLQDDGHRRD